jgi:hypothetical protein
MINSISQTKPADHQETALLALLRVKRPSILFALALAWIVARADWVIRNNNN